MIFNSINPSRQQLVAKHPLMDGTAINNCPATATTVFTGWKKTNFKERAAVFTKLATLLKRDSEKFTAFITNEMSKVITEARAEVEKCGTVCEYSATSAATFLQDDSPDAGYVKSSVTYEPIGAVLARWSVMGDG